MKAELLRADGMPPGIRVTAQRKTRTMTAVLHVDFDADSYRPRLRTIRFETPERAIEFRLAATEIRRVSSTELKSSLFSPELSAFAGRSFSGAPPEQLAAAGALPPTTPYSSLRTESEMLEAHDVLHQAGACLGEPVKIEFHEAGIRIQNRSRDSWSQSFTSMTQMEVVSSAFAELREAAPPRTDSPEGGDAGFESATALRHAWALSRLARHFPLQRTDRLVPERWRLLEIMVRDHVTRIESELERVHLQQDQDLPGRVPQRGWRDSSALLFEALLNAHELLREEPIVKVVPMLQEVNAELHRISVDFSSEYFRSQVAAAKASR